MATSAAIRVCAQMTKSYIYYDDSGLALDYTWLRLGVFLTKFIWDPIYQGNGKLYWFLFLDDSLANYQTQTSRRTGLV